MPSSLQVSFALALLVRSAQALTGFHANAEIYSTRFGQKVRCETPADCISGKL